MAAVKQCLAPVPSGLMFDPMQDVSFELSHAVDALKEIRDLAGDFFKSDEGRAEIMSRIRALAGLTVAQLEPTMPAVP